MKVLFVKITFLSLLVFLMKIIYTGELAFFIHPRYFVLIYISLAFFLLSIALARFEKSVRVSSSVLFFMTIMFVMGSLVSFSPLTSFANDQKYSNLVGSFEQYNRMKRTANFSFNSEDKTLEDWVSLLSINPEPKRYEGQSVRVFGFYYIHPDGTPMIGRYTLSCCAADASIIGLALDQELDLEEDTWIEINGFMKVIENNTQRFLAIDVVNTELQPVPKNPYIVR